MKDTLIDVFLFLALIFGLIALVMGHVALLDMRATESVAPTEEPDEILCCAQDDTRDDTSSVSLRLPPSPRGEGLRGTRDGETPHPSAALTPSPRGEGLYRRAAASLPQGEGLPEQMDELGYLSVVGQNEINMLAYLVDMEIGGGTRVEKEAVVWCVLNRVDKGRAGGFRDTVYGVLTQSGQFRSYYGTGSNESYNIVVDVLTLWMMERQSGYPVSGRVLPRDYCWYHGDGRHNHFKNAYKGGTEWDWSWTGGY